MPAVCQRCRHAARSFSTSSVRRGVGPEHPQYIEIPQAPQQSARYRPVVKGTLPVPRELFGGKRGKWERRQESIALSTKERESDRGHDAGSFNAFRTRLAATRRQNLRDGLAELQARQQKTHAIRDQRSAARLRERYEAVHRPEREDERLTTPSNNFDVDELMRGLPQNEDKTKALAESKERYAMIQAGKQQERQDHLHTLFTKARSFIVNTDQLDDALEKSFGTDEAPFEFNKNKKSTYPQDRYSIWAEGVPYNVRELMTQARDNTAQPTKVNESYLGPRQAALSSQRVRKIAEVLTGGTID